MPYDKTTVTADKPASSDSDILERIRELATQPRQPLAPMIPIRDPGILAIAGGFNPDFRANVVDPLIAQRQMRPQAEQAYADEGQQQEIRNLTGLQEMQQRQGYLDLARDDRARANMMKDSAITGNIQKLGAIGQQIKAQAGSAKRLIDIIGQRPEPYFKGMSQRIQGTLEEIDGIFQELVKNPTMEPDAAEQLYETLADRMSDIDDALDHAMQREDQLRQFAAENQAAKDQANLESGLRVGEEVVKAGLKGEKPNEMTQKDRDAQDNYRSMLSGLDVVESLVSKGVGGPIEGNLSAIVPGRAERLDLDAAASNISSFLANLRSGGAIPPEEFARLEPFLPSVNKTRSKNLAGIKELKRYFGEKLQFLMEHYGQSAPSNGLEEGDVVIGETGGR